MHISFNGAAHVHYIMLQKKFHMYVTVLRIKINNVPNTNLSLKNTIQKYKTIKKT